MSVEIIPSIIAEHFEQIRGKLERLRGLVTWAQIDVVDGLFATPPTWPYKREEEVAELKELLRQPRVPKIEVHLMIENPESEIERWMDSGVSRVWFHYEATPHVNELLSYCETPRFGLSLKGKPKIFRPCSEIGVTLKLNTSASALDHISHPPNFIQLMSIGKIGSYGASFDEAVFPKIEYLRRKFPHAKISVDGGVSLENAAELITAGATQLIVGSAIWQARDLRTTLEKFRQIASRGTKF